MSNQLPPLPKDHALKFGYTTEQMQAYAIAAIEAQASEVQQKPLTDEQIIDAISPLYAERRVALIALSASRDEYRAIESAATAPLLQRIAELERQLRESRNNFRLIEGRAGHPEDVWVMSRKAIKAIDAAMQKGQS